MKLDHIGIVVPELETSLRALTELVSFDEVGPRTHVPAHKVNVCHLRSGTTRVELIEPAAGRSPVSALARKGGGFHHLAFTVADLERTLADLRRRGAIVVRRPLRGYGGRVSAFVLLHRPEAPLKLVELVEEREA